MSTPSVPMAKAHLSQQELAHQSASPGTGELHSAFGRILAVFDQESLSKFPNLLVAQVLLNNGLTLFRPFRDTVEQVYSTHGNSAVLQGAPIKVEFNNTRVREGSIVVVDDVFKTPVSLPLAVETWDIGLLV